MMILVPCRLTVNDDAATRLFHDSVDCCQTQSRAPAWLFGCEERFENVRLGLGIHAVTGVARRRATNSPVSTPMYAAECASSTITFEVWIVSVPPSSMASRALIARFIMIWSICVGVAKTCQRSEASSVCR